MKTLYVPFFLCLVFLFFGGWCLWGKKKPKVPIYQNQIQNTRNKLQTELQVKMSRVQKKLINSETMFTFEASLFLNYFQLQHIQVN